MSDPVLSLLVDILNKALQTMTTATEAVAIGNAALAKMGAAQDNLGQLLALIATLKDVIAANAANVPQEVVAVLQQIDVKASELVGASTPPAA